MLRITNDSIIGLKNNYCDNIIEILMIILYLFKIILNMLNALRITIILSMDMEVEHV
jgi:hypothetical protein